MTTREAKDIVEDLQDFSLRMRGVGTLMGALIDQGEGESTGIFELLEWVIEASEREANQKLDRLKELLDDEDDNGPVDNPDSHIKAVA